MSKFKNSVPNTKPCLEPYKIDLKVKGKRCFGIRNVFDTLSTDYV